ncbi:MAG: primosomal protein N', partial [Methylococcales bacterium]|nr:primosomal protein N' [Methylococcales bacterium]
MKLKNPPILRVALPVILDQLFDYSIPETDALKNIKLGVRVLVTFRGQEKVGILIETATSSSIKTEKLKPILKVLDLQPLLNSKDRQLLQWLCQYYHHPIGYVFCNTLPTLLKKGETAVLEKEAYFSLSLTGKKINPTSLKHAFKQQFFLKTLQASVLIRETELKTLDKSWTQIKKVFLKKNWLEQQEHYCSTTQNDKALNEVELTLNKAQQQAVTSLHNALGKFAVFLLEGVTGSGKTEVYMQLINKVLQKNQQILLLLPEITLTPQLENRFRQRFKVPIVIYHSKLSDKQRLQTWLAIQQGEASILLGTRSALFTPFKNLGLIILDEEHDSSFKQQEQLRFSARDVAIMRAKLNHIPIILGSATPSLESLSNVEKKRFQKLVLPHRAGNACPPKILILDIRNKQMHQGLSAVLLQHIEQTLHQKQQVLIFLNRRGFAPRLMCHGCGW